MRVTVHESQLTSMAEVVGSWSIWRRSETSHEEPESDEWD